MGQGGAEGEVRAGLYENGEPYLAVGLYEGYAPLLQWSQAKGDSHLGAERGR